VATRSRILWTVLTAILLAASGLGWFAAGIVWLVDFDDSDASSGRAGASAVILTVSIVGALIAGAARRSADGAGRRTTCGVLLFGGVVAALPWLGAL
jgi:hypothetical protein